MVISRRDYYTTSQWTASQHCMQLTMDSVLCQLPSPCISTWSGYLGVGFTSRSDLCHKTGSEHRQLKQWNILQYPSGYMDSKIAPWFHVSSFSPKQPHYSPSLHRAAVNCMPSPINSTAVNSSIQTGSPSRRTGPPTKGWMVKHATFHPHGDPYLSSWATEMQKNRPAYPKILLSVLQTACVRMFDQIKSDFFSFLFFLQMHQSINQNKKVLKDNFPIIIL